MTQAQRDRLEGSEMIFGGAGSAIIAVDDLMDSGRSADDPARRWGDTVRVIRSDGTVAHTRRGWALQADAIRWARGIQSGRIDPTPDDSPIWG